MSAESLQEELIGWIMETKENGGNRLHRSAAGRCMLFY